MGWHFKWVSAAQTDFNYDYHVSFTPETIRAGTVFYNYRTVETDDDEREGVSVFYKDEHGGIFHTYSCFARGIDMMNGTYQYLDLVPKGRDEDVPEGPQAWVRHHDRYED